MMALSIRSTGATDAIAALDLSGNAFGDVGVEALAAAFAARPTRVLRHLNLSSLWIGQTAMTALGRCFRSLDLVELHLGYTAVGALGAMEALCEHFGDLPSLETLGLQRCRMLADGLEVLVTALATLPRLRSLTLDSNTLGNGAVSPLLHAGKTLASLSVQDCALTESEPLVTALDAGAAPLLRQLAIGANAFHETAALVAAAARRRPQGNAEPLKLVNLVENSSVAWRSR